MTTFLTLTAIFILTPLLLFGAFNRGESYWERREIERERERDDD